MNNKQCKRIRAVLRDKGINWRETQYDERKWQGRVGGAPFLGPQRLTRDCGRELYQRIKAATRGLRL